MLLAIDIGNSSICIGVFKNGSMVIDFKFPTDKKSGLLGYEEIICRMFHLFTRKNVKQADISGVIISSVVPEVDTIFKRLITKLFNTKALFINSNTNLGIKLTMENPLKVGADRLANACAAHFTVKGDVIVIDFGTATTFDYVTKEGEFVGGVIAPGISISVEALYKKASKLPVIELSPPKRVIGKNTVEAMQSGIYNGYIGLVENIVAKMKKEINTKVKVLATGGAFELFGDDLKIIDIYNKKLTLNGLGIIYNINKPVIL